MDEDRCDKFMLDYFKSYSNEDGHCLWLYSHIPEKYVFSTSFWSKLMKYRIINISNNKAEIIRELEDDILHNLDDVKLLLEYNYDQFIKCKYFLDHKEEITKKYNL